MLSSLGNYTFVPVLDRYYGALYGVLAFAGEAASSDEIAEITANYSINGDSECEAWDVNQLIDDLQERGYDVVLLDADYKYFV